MNNEYKLSFKKTLLIEETKDLFKDLGIFYKEYKNGHLKIDQINFWATTGKWSDPNTGDKGVGINSFLIYFNNR